MTTLDNSLREIFIHLLQPDLDSPTNWRTVPPPEDTFDETANTLLQLKLVREEDGVWKPTQLLIKILAARASRWFKEFTAPCAQANKHLDCFLDFLSCEFQSVPSYCPSEEGIWCEESFCWELLTALGIVEEGPEDFFKATLLFERLYWNAWG
jgi:hypothetical protein